MLIISVCIGLIIVSGATGYWIGLQNNRLVTKLPELAKANKESVVTSTLGVPIMTTMPQMSAAPVQGTYAIPTRGTVIEVCSYPWDNDLLLDAGHYTECLEFDIDGMVTRKLHDPNRQGETIIKTLGTNVHRNKAERANLAIELRRIYRELTQDKYLQWTKTLRAPLVGSNSPTITLYSGDLDKQYSAVKYQLGTDSSAEGVRLREIVERLKLYSRSVET